MPSAMWANSWWADLKRAYAFDGVERPLRQKALSTADAWGSDAQREAADGLLPVDDGTQREHEAAAARWQL
jgi:hypothetical protein